MKILVLVNDQKIAEQDARMNSGPNVRVTIRPNVVVRKEGVEVWYFTVKSANDVERLRGMRFDLLIEDGSFNHERSYEKGRWLDLARMTVLR